MVFNDQTHFLNQFKKILLLALESMATKEYDELVEQSLRQAALWMSQR